LYEQDGRGGSDAAHAAGKVDSAVQAAPTPWTRFYFREDLTRGPGQGAVNQKSANQFFQHFDIMEVPAVNGDDRLSTDRMMEEALPVWCAEAYQRLTYSRHRSGFATPPVLFKGSSQDLAKSAKLFR
jgi:hypothetical protein